MQELGMSVEQENGKPIDPFEMLREVRDKYLDSMSKLMISAVNSEEYAQATGAMLDGYLTLSAPVREAIDKAMVLTLEQLSLPSRQQIAALAERFTNIEMRLDDLDAKLDRIVELSSANRSPAVGVDSEARQTAKAEVRPPQKANARKV
jgi:hypothetical protein